MSNVLVPEFSVRDCVVSQAFYCDILGFHVVYARPEEGFCYLAREGAELMLDQIGVGRDFGNVSTDDPSLGRGVNIQIRVQQAVALAQTCTKSGIPLVLPLEDRWYRKGSKETGNRQFVVADPDGYLLRFFEDLGERSLSAADVSQ